MFSKLKYFFLYCYEASEKMEAKAEKFEAERAKRMESFRADREAAHERMHAHFDDVKGQVQGQVREALSTMGVATTDEVNEIKTLLTDLAKKVDQISK